jgi:hypothetical protein
MDAKPLPHGRFSVPQASENDRLLAFRPEGGIASSEAESRILWQATVESLNTFLDLESFRRELLTRSRNGRQSAGKIRKPDLARKRKAVELILEIVKDGFTARALVVEQLVDRAAELTPAVPMTERTARSHVADFTKMFPSTFSRGRFLIKATDRRRILRDLEGAYRSLLKRKSVPASEALPKR